MPERIHPTSQHGAGSLSHTHAHTECMLWCSVDGFVQFNSLTTGSSCPGQGTSHDASLWWFQSGCFMWLLYKSEQVKFSSDVIFVFASCFPLKSRISSLVHNIKSCCHLQPAQQSSTHVLAVMGLECEQEGAEDTAMVGLQCAAPQCRRCAGGANSSCVRSVCEEVQYPDAKCGTQNLSAPFAVTSWGHAFSVNAQGCYLAQQPWWPVL